MLGDVCAAVEDWRRCASAIREAIAELDDPPPIDDRRARRGARPPRVARRRPLHLPRLPRVRDRSTEDGRGRAPRRARNRARHPPRREEARLASFASCRPRCAASREKNLLNLTKANSRATVHRPVYLDYVGVKRFDDDGRGRRRAPLPRPLHAHRLPRHAVGDPRAAAEGAACARALGCCPGATTTRRSSRSSRRTRATRSSRSPRTSCSRSRSGILHLGERRRVRLFVRRDVFGRFFSCLVYLPRDRFNTENRRKDRGDPPGGVRRRQRRLRDRVSASVLARLHFVVYAEPGHDPSTTSRELEARLAAATRDWTDDLRDALVRAARRGAGRPLFESYGEAFPGAYRDGLPRPPGRARRQPDGAARAGRRPRHEPLPAPRLGARPPRVQAAPLRAADPALGRAAAAREHGRQGHRRAPVRGAAARRRRRSGSTTSGSGTRRARVPGRRRPRDVPGRVRARLARRGRERRLQPARALRAG